MSQRIVQTQAVAALSVEAQQGCKSRPTSLLRLELLRRSCQEYGGAGAGLELGHWAKSALPKPDKDQYQARAERRATNPSGDGALLLHLCLDVTELKHTLLA